MAYFHPECYMLLCTPGSAEREGVEPHLETQTSPLRSRHRLTHRESRQRESEALPFSKQHKETSEQKASGQHWKPGDILLTGAQLAKRRSPRGSEGEPENCPSDVRIIAL